MLKKVEGGTSLKMTWRGAGGGGRAWARWWEHKHWAREGRHGEIKWDVVVEFVHIAPQWSELWEGCVLQWDRLWWRPLEGTGRLLLCSWTASLFWTDSCYNHCADMDWYLDCTILVHRPYTLDIEVTVLSLSYLPHVEFTLYKLTLD